MKKKHKQLWLDRSLVVTPYYYRLCVTEKDFHKELKRLELPKSSWPKFINTGANATLHEFVADSNDNAMCAIICLDKKDMKSRTKPQVYAMLVHEATHLWQWTKDNLGEKAPSAEFEAYAIQSLSQRLFESWEKQTK